MSRSIYIRCSSDGLLMQDSREIDYFGQRILQIVQPLAAGGDRRNVLSMLAQSIANNFAADGCWVLQYPAPKTVRVAASACFSHRTNSITPKLTDLMPPPAQTPCLWRMPLLPDYQVMVVETRNEQQINGCLIVATKGVEWYRETKLVLQIVSDYVSTALIEEELYLQAQISELYPKLYYSLAQAIAENQPTNRLFEIAVSDIVSALQLKRGLALSIKSQDSSQKDSLTPLDGNSATDASTVSEPAVATTNITDREASHESIDTSTEKLVMSKKLIVSKQMLGVGLADSVKKGEQTSAPAPESAPVEATETGTQVQIITTIDRRKGNLPALPPSFLLENSQFCQTALANAPNPTIFPRQERANETDRAIFQTDRLPSIAMIPLVDAISPTSESDGEIWGWLVLQHDELRYWHPVELKLLQCQIHQIALARIHRTSLQQASSNVDNRTSQVQILLQIQTKLLADARNQMEKLKQANELKDEFINTISHELRTPLTSMSLAIKMLQQPGIEPTRQQQYLNILDEQCQREIKLVDDLLKLQQLESKQLDFRTQRISLNQFISDRSQTSIDRWNSSNVLGFSLHLPEISPQIETDPESLQHIIEELLTNAGKFAMPKTTVEVSVFTDPTHVKIQVSNLSQPIPSDDLAHLFETFRRGTGTTERAISGTGMGLTLVKALVEHLKGEVSVTSKPIDATIATTCLTVTIPISIERH
jgi:signal transduction histidine kinase